MTAENDSLDDWLSRALRCPYEGRPLETADGGLRCPNGHAFPVVQGVPVLLRGDTGSTHPGWWTTPQRLAVLRGRPAPPPLGPNEVDPFVRRSGVATCGLLYRGLRDPLPRYPIPSLESLPPGEGRAFVDVGGNWGRWALAAAARGYRGVVADPSLEAALAGARIARQLGREVRYVVADGRHLPFASGAFDVGFSYSVIQSLGKDDARAVIAEMARVTRAGGTVRVQMANVLGVRRLAKTVSEVVRDRWRALRDPKFSPWAFRVRAWTPAEIRRVFEELVGPTELSIDGFFTLNAQLSDVDLLKRRYAMVVHASRALVAASRAVPPLMYFADSLYAEARSAEKA